MQGGGLPPRATPLLRRSTTYASWGAPQDSPNDAILCKLETVIDRLESIASRLAVVESMLALRPLRHSLSETNIPATNPLSFAAALQRAAVGSCESDTSSDGGMAMPPLEVIKAESSDDEDGMPERTISTHT